MVHLYQKSPSDINWLWGIFEVVVLLPREQCTINKQTMDLSSPLSTYHTYCLEDVTVSCENVSFVQLFCGLWNSRCLYAVVPDFSGMLYRNRGFFFLFFGLYWPQIFACIMCAGFCCDRLNCISRSEGKVCFDYKWRHKRVKLERYELKCKITAEGTWAWLCVGMRKHRCAVRCFACNLSAHARAKLLKYN